MTKKKSIPYPPSFQVLEQLVEKTRTYAQGYSLSDLAFASKLSITTVWNLMNRQTRYPRFHTVWALAKALGVDVQFKGLLKADKTKQRKRQRA